MKRRTHKSASALMGGLGRNLAVRSGGGSHKRPQDKRAKQKLARTEDAWWDNACPDCGLLMSDDCRRPPCL